jgi:hypothetical protein
MSHWQFRTLHPNDNSGTSTVEDNFANEDRTNVEMLVRETLQNPLDARLEDQKVRVSYQLVSLDRTKSAFAKNLLSEAFENHLTAGHLISGPIPATISFLIIEDFGTSGLEGTYDDSSIDGSAENWNAFWFREGEGAKPAKSNGGAGQGKVTLYTTSAIRSVLALTNRSSDQKSLLFGCCKFRANYKLPGDNQRWAKEALWGQLSAESGLAVPIDDAALIDIAKTELGLLRGSKSGTTFVVPMPRDVSLKDIEAAVLNEFYFAIRRGKLDVQVGQTVIDNNSVGALARKLGKTARHLPEYLEFLDNSIAAQLSGEPTARALPIWANESKLATDCFDAAALKTLMAAFEGGQQVSVDFPVQVRLKDSLKSNPGIFRVIVAANPDGDESHELFVRRDLCIDGEKRLKGSRRVQPVFALTFVDEDPLSKFLATAEEPTHRTWNSKRPKLVARYAVPEKLLNAVRNAALRLVELITPAGKKDDTALSQFFADPASAPQKKKGGKGEQSSTDGEKPDVPDLPEPTKRAVEFIPAKDGFKVRAQKQSALELFPIACDVEVAYATTFGDPFSQWDAAEFWLEDEKAFPIGQCNVSAVTRSGNALTFNLLGLDSEVYVQGFDANRQLEVRVKYKEAEYEAADQDN